MNKQTAVIFRQWKDETIALFPLEASSVNDPYPCESFMHIGQHGGADLQGIIRESRPATPDEYAALKRELESAPYHYTLKVIQRTPANALEIRRKQLE